MIYIHLENLDARFRRTNKSERIINGKSAGIILSNQISNPFDAKYILRFGCNRIQISKNDNRYNVQFRLRCVNTVMCFSLFCLIYM